MGGGGGGGVICRILEYGNEPVQFDSKNMALGICTVFCQSVSI